MAVFEGDYSENKAIGQFEEKQFGHYFEYRLSEGKAPLQGDYGLMHGLLHEVAMGDGSVRFANVKKTVAYICIDEDDTGKPIMEKWAIKTIWSK